MASRRKAEDGGSRRITPPTAQGARDACRLHVYGSVEPLTACPPDAWGNPTSTVPRVLAGAAIPNTLCHMPPPPRLRRLRQLA
jgi:hypothetical protein